ncbi:MAG: bifunctional folylpolyglutamate synthase/dihydrofolate synthase [Myxococcales bacterium]|nr:bifunctional folylpolyglutamate synthase/dihydrofolate synthase [Myxococcales bacterium]
MCAPTVSAESFFDALDPFGMELGLERMRALLRALGEPQRGLHVLQIAGTNGKGSAAATASALLRAAGSKVGLYTSPHLVRLSERIQIDGREIDEAALAAGVERLRRAMQSTGLRPTYFEALTAVAIDHFAREGVDVAILEVGLGGRLDATSAVAPEVAIITRIALDHTALLGATLASIAREKAAILKAGTRAFIARQPDEAREVIAWQAAEQGAECLFAGQDFALKPEGSAGDRSLFFEDKGKVRVGPLRLALEGDHQIDNAEVAIAAALALSSRIEGERLRRGLLDVVWPGRFQTVACQPITVVDGAHNPDGARALAQTCLLRFPAARPRLVFSALADKDVSGVAEQLFPLARSIHLVALDNPRALTMGALAAHARERGTAFDCHEALSSALGRARELALADGPDGWVLAAGSLYLVGEVLALMGRV